MAPPDLRVKLDGNSYEALILASGGSKDQVLMMKGLCKSPEASLIDYSNPEIPVSVYCEGRPAPQKYQLKTAYSEMPNIFRALSEGKAVILPKISSLSTAELSSVQDAIFEQRSTEESEQLAADKIFCGIEACTGSVELQPSTGSRLILSCPDIAQDSPCSPSLPEIKGNKRAENLQILVRTSRSFANFAEWPDVSLAYGKDDYKLSMLGYQQLIKGLTSKEDSELAGLTERVVGNFILPQMDYIFSQDLKSREMMTRGFGLYGELVDTLDDTASYSGKPLTGVAAKKRARLASYRDAFLMMPRDRVTDEVRGINRDLQIHLFLNRFIQHFESRFPSIKSDGIDDKTVDKMLDDFELNIEKQILFPADLAGIPVRKRFVGLALKVLKTRADRKDGVARASEVAGRIVSAQKVDGKFPEDLVPYGIDDLEMRYPFTSEAQEAMISGILSGEGLKFNDDGSVVPALGIIPRYQPKDIAIQRFSQSIYLMRSLQLAISPPSERDIALARIYVDANSPVTLSAGANPADIFSGNNEWMRREVEFQVASRVGDAKGSLFERVMHEYHAKLWSGLARYVVGQDTANDEITEDEEFDPDAIRDTDLKRTAWGFFQTQLAEAQGRVLELRDADSKGKMNYHKDVVPYISAGLASLTSTNIDSRQTKLIISEIQSLPAAKLFDKVEIESKLRVRLPNLSDEKIGELTEVVYSSVLSAFSFSKSEAMLFTLMVAGRVNTSYVYGFSALLKTPSSAQAPSLYEKDDSGATVGDDFYKLYYRYRDLAKKEPYAIIPEFNDPPVDGPESGMTGEMIAARLQREVGWGLASFFGGAGGDKASVDDKAASAFLEVDISQALRIDPKRLAYLREHSRRRGTLTGSVLPAPEFFSDPIGHFGFRILPDQPKAGNTSEIFDRIVTDYRGTSPELREAAIKDIHLFLSEESANPEEFFIRLGANDEQRKALRDDLLARLREGPSGRAGQMRRERSQLGLVLMGEGLATMAAGGIPYTWDRDPTGHSVDASTIHLIRGSQLGVGAILFGVGAFLNWRSGGNGGTGSSGWDIAFGTTGGVLAAGSIATTALIESNTIFVKERVRPTEEKPKDSDGDGVPDFTDNCIGVMNPRQEDSNSNGKGNACEDVASGGTGGTIGVGGNF